MGGREQSKHYLSAKEFAAPFSDSGSTADLIPNVLKLC